MDTKLTTIVCSDVIGYSTLMQQDESTTLAKLDKCKSIIEPLIDSSKGRLFNTGGDSLLIEFSSAVDAVRFGIQMQDSLYKLNNNMNWRIGIHAGEVWIYGTNLMGDAVNLAARTESLADYKGVTMTDTVYKLVSPKIKDYKFISRGLQQFKNVEPMEIWSVVLPYSQPNPNLNRAIFKEPTQKKSHSELISAVLNDQAARNLSVTNAIAFKHDNRFGPATRILMFRALKHDTKAIEELVNFMEKDIIPKDLLAYVYAVLREIHHKVESNLALRIVDLVKDVSHSLSMQYLRHAAKVNEQANQRLAVAVFNNPYSSPAEIEEIVQT
jgi:class 3 adenylate cyclase